MKIENEIEKYNPKVKDISKRMIYNSYKFGKKVAKKTTLSIALAIGVNLGCYIIPSMYNAGNHNCPDKSNDNFIDENNYEFIVNSITAIGFLFQAGLYCYSYRNEHPEALLIPLTTNALSGVYEFYRHTKQELIEEEKTNLEFKLLEEKTKNGNRL